MSDLTKLKATILEQAHHQGRLKLEQALQQHDVIYKEKYQSLLQEKEHARQRRLKQLESQYSRKEQQLLNQERQSLLAIKQDTLKSLFDEAVSHMNQWSSQEQFDFVSRVLSRYVNQEAVVTFGELTFEVLGASFLEKLRTQFPMLTFSSQTLKQQGGFVVTRGKIDDNYLYETLVASIRQSHNYQLATQIFEQV